MTRTIGDYSLENQLIQLEEQVKQLKTTQRYPTFNAQNYATATLSASSFGYQYVSEWGTWLYQSVGVLVQFTGIYPGKTAIGQLYTKPIASSEVNRSNIITSLRPGNESHQFTAYTLWADSGVQGYSTPPAFDLEFHVEANMPGAIQVLKVEDAKNFVLWLDGWIG